MIRVDASSNVAIMKNELTLRDLGTKHHPSSTVRENSLLTDVKMPITRLSGHGPRPQPTIFFVFNDLREKTLLDSFFTFSIPFHPTRL